MKTVLRHCSLAVSVAIAASGSASAGIVVDNFSSGSSVIGGTTTSFTGINGQDISTSSSYLPVAGSANRRRIAANTTASYAGFNLGPAMTSRVDVTAGNAAISLSGGSITGSQWSNASMSSYFSYGTDSFSSGQSVDLSSMTSANIVGSGLLSVTSGVIPPLDIVMILHSGTASRTWKVSLGAGAVGNQAFDLTSGFTSGGSGSFSMSNVTYISYGFVLGFGYSGNYGSTAAGSGAFNYNLSQFGFVPAPGAMALMGVAGLCAGRRRR